MSFESHEIYNISASCPFEDHLTILKALSTKEASLMRKLKTIIDHNCMRKPHVQKWTEICVQGRRVFRLFHNNAVYLMLMEVMIKSSFCLCRWFFSKKGKQITDCACINKENANDKNIKMQNVIINSLQS